MPGGFLFPLSDEGVVVHAGCAPMQVRKFKCGMGSREDLQAILEEAWYVMPDRRLSFPRSWTNKAW